MVFPGDPLKLNRSEDGILAQAWREYIDDPDHREDWIPRLPMVKAAFQTMRAAQEFVEQENIAKIEGWMVTGASKRGWTTFLLGGVRCDTCAAKVIAIAPLVPIVPDLLKEMHRQWQSYDGFTWAFCDYIDAHLIQELDSDIVAGMFKISDPANYFDGRLAEIPKYIVVASDDEFMSMDWSNIYYDKLQGEKHLSIMPNSEHQLTTGMYGAISSLGTFMRSLAKGTEERPSFDYQYNPETGELSVTVPKDKPQPEHVYLRHAQTMSTVRRDFRWVVASNNFTQLDCKFPYIPLPPSGWPDIDKHLCAQPIVWHANKLHRSTSDNGDFVYSTMPPEPEDGHWNGYYIELIFAGDTEGPKIDLFKNAYFFSTPGFTWPNTLPFEDCHGESCIPRTV